MPLHWFGRIKSILFKKWAFAFLLLALTVILRSPALHWPAMEEDEACHFTGAAVIADGGLPYEDITDGKTPLLWYLFAAVVKVAGPFNSVAHRLFTDLNVWATALLIWWLGTLLGSSRAGRWGALLFSLFSICSSYKILSSNYELHFLPFDVLSYCLFVFALKNKKPWFALGSGACIATIFFIKQTSGISLATQAVFCLAYGFFQKDWRGGLKTLLNLTAGFILSLGAYVWWMKKIGVLDQMLFWTWDYAWVFTKSSAEKLPTFTRFLGRWGGWFAGTFIVHVWALRWMWQQRKVFSFSWLIFLWVLMEWVAIPLGGRYPPHYFLVYLPPLCLLAGLWANQTGGLRGRSLAFIAIFFLLPIGGSFGAAWFIPASNRLFHLKRADHFKLAERIQKETAPTDRIFVWGHNPEFYVFSKRLPASRFAFADFMTGRHSIPSQYVKSVADYDRFVIPESWGLLFKDFEKHPPALIIDTSPADLHDYKIFPMSHYPLLAEYVANHYALAWIEDEVHFYKRKK